MSKMYKVKVNAAEGKGELVELPPVRSDGAPVRLKAQPGVRYQLFDPETGYAPENIRVDRKGKDLRVFFEGRPVPDLVLEDYYEAVAPGFNALIGEAENGRFYEYIPESAQGMASVPALTEGTPASALALGGLEVSPAGAAVGTLVAAGFPWLGLAGAGAAAAAVAGGGGGGGGGGAGSDNGSGDSGNGGNGGGNAPPGTTLPEVKSANLLTDDDSGPKDNVTNDNTPRISGQTQAHADVVLTVNGKTYTGKADASGAFVIAVTDVLPDGTYTPEIIATDAAGNASKPFAGTPFSIDTRASHNGETPDPNGSALPEIVSISEDTGYSPSDFITRDRTLKFAGTLQGFEDSGGWLQATLKQAGGAVIATEFIKPDSTGKTWEWDQTQRSLPDGEYRLEIAVVDKAGNIIRSAAKAVVVDNAIGTNGNTVDPNAGLSFGTLSLTEDTGRVGDLVTRDRTLSFNGSFDKPFVDNGDRLLVQVAGQDGRIVSQQYVKPAGSAWSFDNLTELGVPEGTRQYTLGVTLVDAAGNALKATDQTFLIDTQTSITEKSQVSKGASAWTYSLAHFSAEERGQYAFSVDGKRYSREYEGGVFDISEALGRTFAPGQFTLSFTDASGNLYVLTNSAVSWDFSKAVMGTADGTMPALLPEITFGGTRTVGSVGKLVLTSEASELDVAGLYTQTPKTGDLTAVNHIDARDGDHVLLLTMGDVLALGVKDSFSVAAPHKGHLQMRIDGDSKDVLKLDDLVGNTEYQWNSNQSAVTLDGRTYKVLSNADLGLDLFVESDIRIEAS